MDVIELLKADHEAVSGLFRSFESAKKSESESEKRQIAGKICKELDVHARVEEEFFYPALEARAGEDEKAESSVLEAHEEHALLKTLVAELSQSSSRGDGQFDAKVKVLKDLVEHHVKEEEGTMMPKARKLLSSEELEEIGQHVETRKQELQSEAPSARRKAASARSERPTPSRSSRRASSPSRPATASSRSTSRSRAKSASTNRSGAPRSSRRRSAGRRKRSS